MKTRRLFQLFCIVSIVCFASLSLAADKYVRKGASGSGTSWSDAYGDFNNVNWSGLSGYTLWVAGGSYTGSLPYMNNVDNVTIKRATIANHGTAPGWSDAYDGQVTVSPSGAFLDADGSDNFTLDGVSNNPWKFKVVGVRGSNGMILFEGASNPTFRNIEMDGNGEGGATEDGLRFGGLTNLLVEYSYIHDYRHKLPAHNDAVQFPSGTNATFRYNIFANSGQHLFVGDCDWGGQYVNGIRIIYNVFYNASGIGGSSYNTIVFKGVNQSGANPDYIENNTFAIRSSESSRSALYYYGGCADKPNFYFRNNILYDSGQGDVASNKHSNNAYYLSGTAPTETGRVTSNPIFSDYAANNFRLQSGSPAKDAGAPLGYLQDLLGTAVPQNLIPDMGAYEFGSGTANAKPSPPVLLSIQ